MGRWRILDHTGASLCYSPTKVAKIAITCVLHNVCRRNGTPILGHSLIVVPLNLSKYEDEDDQTPKDERRAAAGKRQCVATMLWNC